MKNAIQFVAEDMNINKDTFKAMFHGQMSLSFHSNFSSVKNDSETGDSIHIIVIEQIVISNHIGLYCEDTIRDFKNISGQQTEKLK